MKRFFIGLTIGGLLSTAFWMYVAGLEVEKEEKQEKQ